MTAPLYQHKIELMICTDILDTDTDEKNFCLDYQSYYVTLTFKYQGSLITLMYSIET